MLTNALLAGAFGAAYLTILVLQLNPDVPLVSAAAWWWFVTLGMLYGVHFAVLFYAALVAREFFTMQVLSPGWASVRLLAWLGAVLAAGAALLMWLNVRGLGATLGDAAEWRMTAGAVAATVSAVLLLAIAVAHYSFGRRGSRVGASLFAIAVAGSMALPLAARGPATSVRGTAAATAGARPPETAGGPRVTLVLLDAASLEHIWPRAARGGLPTFSRILDGGAAVDLATIRPTQPGPVWAVAATGLYPDRNGIRSAARYYALRDRRGVSLLPDHSLSHALVHLGFVRHVPLTSADWNVRPVWSILADAGLSSGIVRWPLTHPARTPAGFIVSERLHQVIGSFAEFERAVYPPVLRRTVEETIALAEGSPATAVDSVFAGGSPEDNAMQRDLLYSRIGHALRADVQPRLFAIRYEGLDTIGHYYLRYAQGRAPRDVPEEERRRFAEVVDRYYAFVDRELGAVVSEMTPGDLLLVISGFGMHAMGPVKQALGRLLGDPKFTGTHDRAPDGFLLAFGTTVQPGRPPRGSIADITPTLLYFFGLPVGRDMDGYARADLFTRDFTAERPITFIPTYR